MSSWTHPQVNALVTRYLEGSGVPLDGMLLTVLAPYICALGDAEIKALSSEAIRCLVNYFTSKRLGGDRALQIPIQGFSFGSLERLNAQRSFLQQDRSWDSHPEGRAVGWDIAQGEGQAAMQALSPTRHQKLFCAAIRTPWGGGKCSYTHLPGGD